MTDKELLLSYIDNAVERVSLSPTEDTLALGVAFQAVFDFASEVGELDIPLREFFLAVADVYWYLRGGADA